MGGSSGGGGGTTVVNPSTTTTVQDIPAWEQGYVTDLLGQAQTIAAQPYQQFPGQQVAGFTPDQLQAFSNIENMPGSYEPTTQAGVDSAMQGANTAGSIYGAGAGDINAATSYNPLAAIAPYLGAASQYNSASASQPWLNQAAGYENAAANTATPQGIQNYMSPYTNSVVQGLQNEANLNWNQNIMPNINNEFVGSGQYGSGRNAQVLGQAAGNFQTGLSSNIANALEAGYNTAGSQAANQANLLGNLGGQSLTGASTAGNAQGQQITNLLNQAGAAGTGTAQQASNLQTAGTNLGNLAATQGNQELQAGTALGALGNLQQTQGLTQAQALQATGQQQQQLNQTNLNTAQQNWQNQVNYPAQQTEYLNQIIRGLPAPTASTSAAQTPAYSVSPLSGIGGAGTAALALTGSNGQTVGNLLGAKRGGLAQKYASGGKVDNQSDDDNSSPLDYAVPDDSDAGAINPLAQLSDDTDGLSQMASDASQITPDQSAAAPPVESSPQSSAPTSPLAAASPVVPPSSALSPAQMQQTQLLALAKGMLTPTLGGRGGFDSLGQGIGNLEDTMLKQQEWNAQQQNLNYQRQIEQQRLAIEQKKADTLDDYKNQQMKMMGWETKTLPNGKMVSVNKLTNEVRPINLPAGMGGGVNQNTMGYEIGTVPEGTTAPVLDPKFNLSANAPPGQQEQTRRAQEKQLDADNATANINKDAILRLEKAKDDIKQTYTGGFSNLPGVSSIYDAFSTPRQEISSLNKELALAPGERPAGMRLTQGEVYMLKQAVPGNDKSQEANLNIANAAIAVRQRPIEYAQFKNDFMANNGYWNDAVGNQMFNKYINDNPIFDPKAISDPTSPQGNAFSLNPNRKSLEDYANSGGFKMYGVKGTTASKGAPAATSAPQDPLAALLAEKARRQSGSQ